MELESGAGKFDDVPRSGVRIVLFNMLDLGAGVRVEIAE